VPGNAEGKRTGKRAGQGRAKAARKTRLAAEVAFSLHSAGMPQVLVRLNRRLGLNKGTRHGTVDSPRPERWVASLALGAMKTLSAFDGREWFWLPQGLGPMFDFSKNRPDRTRTSLSPYRLALIQGSSQVSASPYDLELIQRCLSRDRQAWEALVDRSLRIVVQVARHTLHSRGLQVSTADLDDLVSEVFLELCKNEFATLRRFQGSCSFSSYLTVVARRVVVRQLVKRPQLPLATETSSHTEPSLTSQSPASSEDEVTALLEHLSQTEADLIRLYHLEGFSYEEIATRLGLAPNSIGPTLSRAREKMRLEHLRQEAESDASRSEPVVLPFTTHTESDSASVEIRPSRRAA
jgi:RNA polymerase sigma-70 factor (ECF subfamily)